MNLLEESIEQIFLTLVWPKALHDSKSWATEKARTNKQGLQTKNFS